MRWLSRIGLVRSSPAGASGSRSSRSGRTATTSLRSGARRTRSSGSVARPSALITAGRSAALPSLANA